MNTLVLGCGPHGWRPEAVNVDAVRQPDIPNFVEQDFVKDGVPFRATQGGWEHQGWNLIVAEDVIEHISVLDIPRVLSNIFDRLEPGGTLVIKCPNLDTIVNEYVSHRIDAWELVRLLYGHQNSSVHSIHKTGFVPLILRAFLETPGFEVVKIEPRVKDETGRSNNMRFTARKP